MRMRLTDTNLRLIRDRGAPDLSPLPFPDSGNAFFRRDSGRLSHHLA